MKTLFALLLVASFSNFAFADGLGVRQDVSCEAKEDTEVRESKPATRTVAQEESNDANAVRQ